MTDYLYSYKGEEPSSLPVRIKTDCGETRTCLFELSDDELRSLGFTGPFVKPEIDKEKQIIKWNGCNYEIIDLSEEKILFKKNKEKEEEENRRRGNIDYIKFCDRFFTCKIYKKLRLSASQSLSINVFHSELIGLFCDLKSNIVNIDFLQKFFKIMFLVLDLSPEEIEELENIMKETNIDTLCILPDEEYLKKHQYDETTNTIIERCRFDSWVLIDGKWTSPVPFPINHSGKNYKWNEDLTDWVEI